MNRAEIKELAKSKIKGNKWNIIWPVLVIGFLESVIQNIFHLGPGVANIDLNNLEAMSIQNMPIQVSLGTGILSILVGVIMAGYYKYILNFVRTGKFETNDILNTIKEKWLNILIATVLVSVIVGICTIFFVVPGIIMGLAYSMVTFLVIDTDIAGSDALKASREMMNGYKWDYFVFILSFIGWILLVPFTLGILLVWLFPYMTVATTIYYDKLKALTSKKKDE